MIKEIKVEIGQRWKFTSIISKFDIIYRILDVELNDYYYAICEYNGFGYFSYIKVGEKYSIQINQTTCPSWSLIS